MSLPTITGQEHVHVWKSQFEHAEYPVAITGAGISVASGLPTLSASWKGIDLREFFTYEMYLQSTESFFRYYKHMIEHWNGARPNVAHFALAGSGMPIITQNIDGLHQRAGSKHVLEIHGNLQELLCRDCGAIYPSNLVLKQLIPKCPTCRSTLKPNIVLVGEGVYHYGTAVDWVGKADLLLIIGTRLEMAPCHDLPKISERKGAPIIRMNHDAEKILPVLLNKIQRKNL